MKTESETAKYKKAQLTLQAEEKNLADLNKRLADLQNRESGTQTVVDIQTKAKDEILSKYATGQASEASLSEARNKLAVAKKELNDLSEMAEAIQDAIYRLTADSPPGTLVKARDTVQRQHRAAWSEIVSVLASRAPKGMPAYIHNLAVARKQIRGGAVLDLPFGIGTMQMPEMSPEEINRTTNLLEKEFIG